MTRKNSVLVALVSSAASTDTRVATQKATKSQMRCTTTILAGTGRCCYATHFTHLAT